MDRVSNSEPQTKTSLELVRFLEVAHLPSAPVREYTVTEVSNLIKVAIEDNFSQIRVRGEISGLKVTPSGHVYFSLKEDKAVLAAVCWKGVVGSLKYQPEDGLEVLCVGSITTYAGQSKYQLTVYSLSPAGMGALMAILEKRKRQFEKEGLFDQEHKKKLPFLPKTIGIVTSPTGAVIQDILHRISERCPTRVILWPVLVQGETAARSIAAAIAGFNRMPEGKPDVIIVARGGGSVEDLWAFNEEIVVRAVFASEIPIVSAVGHETDTTLIDYVSDIRAPTPTAAAEMVVPVKSDLVRTVEELWHRQCHSTLRYIEHKAQVVASNANRLPNLTMIVQGYVHRLHEVGYRLHTALPVLAQKLGNHLSVAAARLSSPDMQMQLYRSQVGTCLMQITQALKQKLMTKQHELSLMTKLLISYDYKNTLSRGFTITRDKQGNIIRSAQSAPSEATISIEFADGVRGAKLDSDR
jgi:exodeoxyribonuclease VII large subunit